MRISWNLAIFSFLESLRCIVSCPRPWVGFAAICKKWHSRSVARWAVRREKGIVLGHKSVVRVGELYSRRCATAFQ